MSHTPGPWRAHESGNDGEYAVIRADNDYAVAAVHDLIGLNAHQSDANARLIAAAPELLEMLKDYLQWHECAIPKNERDDYETEHLIAGARAAISKATAR